MGVWIISKIRLRNLEIPELETLKVAGHLIPSKRDLESFASKKFSSIYGRLPSKGEIGCSLAHVQAYKHLVRSGLQAILVLEADALPIRDSRNLIPIASKLNVNSREPWILILDEPRIPRLAFQLGRSEHHKYFRIPTPYGTTSYIISRSAAAVILSKSPYWQADWPPHIWGRVKFYAPKAPFYRHLRGPSSISRPGSRPFSIVSLAKRMASLSRLRGVSLGEFFQIIFSVHVRELLFNASRRRIS